MRYSGEIGDNKLATPSGESLVDSSGREVTKAMELFADSPAVGVFTGPRLSN